MALVGEGQRGRIYVSPTLAQANAALVPRPTETPTAELPPAAPSFRVQAYGFRKWADLFTNRQLVALTTLSDLVAEARERVLSDAVTAGMDRGASLEEGAHGLRHTRILSPLTSRLPLAGHQTSAPLSVHGTAAPRWRLCAESSPDKPCP